MEQVFIMKKNINSAFPIMVVNDEDGILWAIESTLSLAGYENIITCKDASQVFNLLSKTTIDVILLDLTMSRIQGENILTSIIENYPEIPVVTIVGTSQVEVGMSFMDKGAFDYLIRPLEEGRLLNVIKHAVEYQDLRRVNQSIKKHMLSNELENPKAFENIVTKNKKMIHIFKYVESIAKSSFPVLITGEKGAGKTSLAKAIYRSSGLKCHFIPIKVSGIDENYFSELLARRNISFDDNNNLMNIQSENDIEDCFFFIDEIEALSPILQEKLLNIIKGKQKIPIGFDAPLNSKLRVIASTTKDIWSFNKKSFFRKDLLYRLLTYHIHIPPLHERSEDIPLLVEYFIESASKSLNKKKPTYPHELITLLQNYTYPGNIKELKDMIYDAISNHNSGVLSLNVFKKYIKANKNKNIVVEDINKPGISAPIIFPKKLPTLKQTAGLLVIEAMKRSKGNQSIASRMLGISQQALSKRLKKMVV